MAAKEMYIVLRAIAADDLGIRWYRSEEPQDLSKLPQERRDFAESKGFIRKATKDDTPKK